jgi:small subunit ribosomal protein S9
MEINNKTGRRKNAVARVYLKEGNGKVTINKRDVSEYFNTMILRYRVNQPFMITQTEGKFDVNVNVHGGGYTGQAEAIRLGIARALVDRDPEMKPLLKAESLMTRDPRMVERKKFGQKKARKKFQFSKR